VSIDLSEVSFVIHKLTPPSIAFTDCLCLLRARSPSVHRLPSSSLPAQDSAHAISLVPFNSSRHPSAAFSLSFPRSVFSTPPSSSSNLPRLSSFSYGPSSSAALRSPGNLFRITPSFRRNFASYTPESPPQPSLQPSEASNTDSSRVVGIMRKFDKHIKSLSTGTILSPTPVLDLLLTSTPAASTAGAVPLPFALQTAKSLLTCYTCVDHFLARKGGEEEMTKVRMELVSAADEIESCWRALLARDDADEETRTAYEGKLVSDLEKIYSRCGECSLPASNLLWRPSVLRASLNFRWHDDNEIIPDEDLNPEFLDDPDLYPGATFDPFAGLPSLSHSPSEKLKFSYLSYKISLHLGQYLDQASPSISPFAVPPLSPVLLRFIQESAPKESFSSIALIQLFLCERVDPKSPHWIGLGSGGQEKMRESVAQVVLELGRVMDEMPAGTEQGVAEGAVRRMLDKRRRWGTALLGLCGKWGEVAKGMKVDCWSIRAEGMLDVRRDEGNINLMVSLKALLLLSFTSDMLAVCCFACRHTDIPLVPLGPPAGPFASRSRTSLRPGSPTYMPFPSFPRSTKLLPSTST
jgi:hypothetical protein